MLARGGDERLEDLGRDELVDLDEIRAAFGELRDLLRGDKITPETAYLIASSKKEFEALVSADFLESRTFL